MLVKKKSSFGIIGRLVVLEKIEDGPTIKVVDDHNIVLNTGKVAAVEWLTNGSSFKITKLAVGNGNRPTVSPSEGDSSLKHQLSEKNVTTSGVDSFNMWTTFRASFNSGDPDFQDGNLQDPGNPSQVYEAEINEAGLILSDGTNDIFFSKKNFLPRPFESTINTTLTFIWMVGVV
jgi:hypothetical protein